MAPRFLQAALKPFLMVRGLYTLQFFQKFLHLSPTPIPLLVMTDQTRLSLHYISGLSRLDASFITQPPRILHWPLSGTSASGTSPHCPKTKTLHRLCAYYLQTPKRFRGVLPRVSRDSKHGVGSVPPGFKPKYRAGGGEQTADLPSMNRSSMIHCQCLGKPLSPFHGKSGDL
jgi:hypothetical protein